MLHARPLRLPTFGQGLLYQVRGPSAVGAWPGYTRLHDTQAAPRRPCRVAAPVPSRDHGTCSLPQDQSGLAAVPEHGPGAEGTFTRAGASSPRGPPLHERPTAGEVNTHALVRLRYSCPSRRTCRRKLQYETGHEQLPRPRACAAPIQGLDLWTYLPLRVCAPRSVCGASICGKHSGVQGRRIRRRDGQRCRRALLGPVRCTRRRIATTQSHGQKQNAARLFRYPPERPMPPLEPPLGEVVCHKGDGTDLMRLAEGNFFGESAVQEEHERQVLRPGLDYGCSRGIHPHATLSCPHPF